MFSVRQHQRCLVQCTRTSEAGQAFPLGIALIAFSMLIGITLFNTGSLFSEKMKITNAADAAAYSGLLWQARALNFQSYTNRAMVANQVSIAQAVTLRSWASYGVIASENVNSVLGGLPYVGAVTNAMEKTFSAAAEIMRPLAETMLATIDQFNGLLSRSQQSMFVASLLATPQIVKKIAELNGQSYRVDSAFSVAGMSKNQSDWNAFTSSYDSSHSSAFNARADIINASRDRFTNRRDWEIFDKFWFYTSPLTRHKIFRRGDTRLVKGEGIVNGVSAGWEWKAKDTVSLQNKIRTFRGTKRKEIPIGWAQAYANSNTQSDNSIESCTGNQQTWLPDNGCPRWLSYNKYAERLSDAGAPAPRSGTDSNTRMNSIYHGIRVFRDLSHFPEQAKDPRLRLTVEVYSPKEAIPGSNGLGFEKPFYTDSVLAKNEIAAMASGEVFFKHPELRSSETKTEYANGYNPFWDIRLKRMSQQDKVLARTARAPGIFAVSSAPPNSVVPTSHNIDASSTHELAVYQEDVGLDPVTLNHETERFEKITQPLTTEFQNTEFPSVLAVELAESIDTAIRSLLGSTFTGLNLSDGVVPGSLAVAQSAAAGYEHLQLSLQEIGTDAHRLETDIDSVNQSAREHSAAVEAEFKRISQTITDRYQLSLTDIANELDSELDELGVQIHEVRAQIKVELNPSIVQALELEVAELEDQVQQVTGSMLDRQADRLVEIVNTSTDLMELDLDTAKRIIVLSEQQDDPDNPLAGLTLDDDGKEGDEYSSDL